MDTRYNAVTRLETAVADVTLGREIPSSNASSNELAERMPSSNDLPAPRRREPGVCEVCGEEMPTEYAGDDRYVRARHGCCLCQDGGRVRVTDNRRDRRFGTTELCECQSSGSIRSREFDAQRSHIPLTLRDASLASWLPENGSPRLRAQSYIAEWPSERFVLLLSGPPGRGKTHIAAGVLRAAWERHGKRGRFYLVPELLDRLRRTNDAENRVETSDDVHAEFQRASIVVLDDLGTERSTGYADEQLFRLVDARYREMRPMVITTNLSAFSFDQRLRSRIADVRHAVVVEIDGERHPDRRLA